MKLIVLVVLSLCAVALGDHKVDQILPPGISENKNLGNTQYDLQLVAPDLDESQQPIEGSGNTKWNNEKSSNSDNADRIISGAFLDMLEELREVVINGNENVPPLDPLVVESYGPFVFRPSPTVSASGVIKDFRMTGLKWFVADRVTINPIRLTVGMTMILPSLTTTGNYEANARIYLLRHSAAGIFRVFAHRIEVGFDMRMGTNIFGGGHLVLRELDIHIDIHDTNISITGMTGSTTLNSLISAMIQNITQEVIQSQLEAVSKALSEELFDVINDILKEYTVSDIFG